MFEEDEEENIIMELPEGARPITPRVTSEPEEEVVEDEPLDLVPQVSEEDFVLELPEGARPTQSPQEGELPSTARPLGGQGGGQGYPRDLFEGDYGPSDLREGARFDIVDNFLKNYYGTDKVDGFSEEEKVDQFLRTWRYIEAGNTVKTVGFVDYVLSTDDLGRRSVAEGYDLFSNMAGVGRGVYSGSETRQAIGSYVWGAIVDPVNVIAPMFGKLFSQAGTTASSRVALEFAKAAAVREVARGAATPIALAAGNRVKGEALRAAVQATGRREALKEIAGATAFDTAVAIGTDIAYQHGLVEAGAQEEQDRIRTGLAALGGLVGGGLSAGVVAIRRGPGDAVLAATDITPRSVTEAADLKGVLADLTGELNKIPSVKFTEVFGAKVGRGKELEAVDSKFWGSLLTGDDEIGFRGLGEILFERGFRYLGKRDEGDNFSNWLGDALRNSPPEEALAFVRKFQEVSGVKLKGMQSPNIGQLADNMAKKMSDSGYALGAMGRVAKQMRSKGFDKITPEDYARFLFGDIDAPSTPAVPSRMQQLTGAAGERLAYFQSTYIRMLVTHPGTSALNIIGWGAKSAGQSASDLLHATVVYGGDAALKGLRFQGKEAAASWNKMAGTYKANFKKMANLVDPYTTFQEYESLVASNPRAFKDITGILPGGVLKTASDEFGMTPKGPFYQEATEKVAGVLQTVSFVKAQDAFSKSQEVMYNLDKLLRQSNLGKGGKGMSYAELVRSPDASVLRNTKAYRAAEAKAIDLSMENIMSKSYKQQSNLALKRVAGLIEDAREIPVVGVHVPFGRFFNNVVATLSEYTGLTLALRGAGMGVGANKTVGELSAKAVVGYAAVASMVPREMELLERGVAWNEQVDDGTGERVDQKYNAPAIAAKWSARVIAHYLKDGEAPQALIEDGRKAILGQLTRQLTESGEAIQETAEAFLRGDGVQAMAALSEMLMSSGSTVAGGATRFMDPTNTMVALSQSAENYAPPDVRTGSKALMLGFRNIDQLIQSVTGPVDVLDRQTPTGEFVSRQPGRAVGIRNVGPQTSASRVFGSIGRPQWDADLFSADRTATNVVVENFQPIFEVFATKLLDNPMFEKAGLDERQIMVGEALAQAREITHRSMETSGDYRNNRNTMIFKLAQSTSIPAIEGYIEELGMGDTELHDLTTSQLEVLKYFIDNDSDMKIEKLYRQ